MTTTDTEADLLRAIAADPGDDVARAAYADLLMERDDPRGAFVQVQLELEQPMACEWMTRGLDCERYNADVAPHRVIVSCPTCSRRAALRRREWELWLTLAKDKKNTAPWFDGLIVYSSAADAVGGFTLGENGPDLQFRRGFIASVTADLATLTGGPCPRCDGTGNGGPSLRCPHCTEGRTPGILADLFRAAPTIERVTVTGREPFGSVVGPDGLVWWYVGPDLDRIASHHLPTEFGKLLKGWLPVTRRNVGGEDLHLEHCRGYTSPAAANAALSAAVVRLGRERAGLAS